jgi:hypothetical protein
MHARGRAKHYQQTTYITCQSQIEMQLLVSLQLTGALNVRQRPNAAGDRRRRSREHAKLR